MRDLLRLPMKQTVNAMRPDWAWTSNLVASGHLSTQAQMHSRQVNSSRAALLAPGTKGPVWFVPVWANWTPRKVSNSNDKPSVANSCTKLYTKKKSISKLWNTSSWKKKKQKKKWGCGPENFKKLVTFSCNPVQWCWFWHVRGENFFFLFKKKRFFFSMGG